MVGFLGLGSMGGLVVERLLAAGHDVTGWNRSREKGTPLVEKGMRWAETPREVGERCDFVLSMLTDGPAVEEVTSGADGLIAGPRRPLARLQQHLRRGGAADLGLGRRGLAPGGRI